MRLAISASSCINPGVFSQTEDTEASAAADFQVQAVDYKEHIEARQLRRLSKVAKMGIYSAKACLAKTEKQQAESLIVATNTGGFSALDSFISSMIEKQEQNLSPVYFLQSLLSDVTGQIVLSLGIEGYTTTYTNRGGAFESSLLDAKILLEEQPNQTVLVGGTDELPASYSDIIRHSNFLDTGGQEGQASDIPLGENAIFFALNTQIEEGDVIISDCQSYLGLAPEQANEKLQAFLSTNAGVIPDLVLSGFYNEEQFSSYFPGLEAKKNVVLFKQYCGEFPTSTAFGVWLAEQVLKGEISPEALGLPETLLAKNILIINQFRASNFSFTLLSTNQ